MKAKTTVDFLNDVKAKYGITSNYALAKLMGQTDTAVARWMHGKNTLSDETAVKVAELLEIEPSFIMACIAAERSKDAKVKAAWKHTAEVLYGLAAVLAVLAVLPFGADIMSAPALLGDHGSLALIGFTLPSTSPTLYIMSNRTRNKIKALAKQAANFFGALTRIAAPLPGS